MSTHRSCTAALLLMGALTLDPANSLLAESHATSVAQSDLFQLPATVEPGDDQEVVVLQDDSHLKLAVVTLRRGTAAPPVLPNRWKGFLHAGETAPVA